VFEKTGSVSAMPPKHKKTSQKREETKIKLEAMVAEFPNLSVRKYASAAEVSPTLIFNILHDDIHLKPYKYQTWHKLEAHDFAPWADSIPCTGIEVPLFDKKVLVWCGISVNRIFGPFYFEKSVNQQNYLEMLQTFFWPRLLKVPNSQNHYFQQDGATPHTANDVQDWLKRKFSRRFLDKTMWPPRSPDLNPCDFFYGVILRA